MYWYKYHIFIRGDSMSFMWKVLAVMGLTGGALLVYKMMNPECVQDMKENLDNMTKKASKKVENMMK